MAATQLFLQSWLAFINCIICFLGLIFGKQSLKIASMGMAVSLFQTVLFTALLFIGQWLLVELLPFGQSQVENTVFWIFAFITLWYCIFQFPSLIKRMWKAQFIEGYLDTVIQDSIASDSL